MKNLSNAIRFNDNFKKQEVYQYTTMYKFVRKYSSIVEAQRMMGIKLGGCLTGTAQTAGGFVWRKEPINQSES